MMIFGTTCHVFIQKQEICVCSLNNKSTMLVILYLHSYALCAMLLLSVLVVSCSFIHVLISLLSVRATLP